MIKVAIVEDEKQWDDTFRKYLSDYGAETGRKFSVESFSDGMDFISDYKGGYDLVLMDIAMPHLNGMDTAKRLREKDKEVCLIFVTTLAQYAINGYEVNAFDFIVKPPTYELFVIKLSKAISLIDRKAQKSFVINGTEGIRKVVIGDIKYIESIKHYLFFHTKDGVYKMRGSLDDIKEKLENDGFAAINRSLVVGLAHVDVYSGAEVTVDGEALPLSRVYKAAFLDKLAAFLGDIR